MKFKKSFILAFVVFVVTINNSFSQTTTTNQITEILKTATIKVRGITCSKDIKLISANIEKLNGVANCTVGNEGKTTTFLVKYNPVLVAEKEIFTSIVNTESCVDPTKKPYKIKQ